MKQCIPPLDLPSWYKALPNKPFTPLPLPSSCARSQVQARADHYLIVLNDRLYAVGGSSESQTEQKRLLEVYDTDRDEWSVVDTEGQCTTHCEIAFGVTTGDTDGPRSPRCSILTIDKDKQPFEGTRLMIGEVRRVTNGVSVYQLSDDGKTVVASSTNAIKELQVNWSKGVIGPAALRRY